MQPMVEEIEADVLIVGGGMAGCGAAFEAAYWAQAKNLPGVLAKKRGDRTKRSGRCRVDAINCFVALKWDWDQSVSLCPLCASGPDGFVSRGSSVRHRPRLGLRVSRHCLSNRADRSGEFLRLYRFTIALLREANHHRTPHILREVA